MNVEDKNFKTSWIDGGIGKPDEQVANKIRQIYFFLQSKHVRSS